MSFNELKYEPRQDWQQTSSGVGLKYRPGYYFPSSNFQTHINQPVPPPLAQQDQIIRDQLYETTTGSAHDRKYPRMYHNSMHKKPPGHWKVDYVKDFAEKLGQGGWRKPLTMGNQTSETCQQFDAKSGIRDKYHFSDTAGLGLPQPYNLRDHHKEGPSKVGEATTQNPKLQGEPFYVKDKGILRLLDPYLSTTDKDHRAFRPEELKSYPKKDVATYWQCEEYPKAWGHGLKHNPLPKDTVPREPLPMVDPTWFRTRTKIPRPPKALIPVPHSGLKSLYNESFVKPSDIKMKEATLCPVDTPWTLPDPGTKSVGAVPKFYLSEYSNLGSGKPISV